MENNENLMTQQVETVEQAPEVVEQPTPKMYSQEEVDAIVGKRNARTRAKIEKEYQRKYGDLEAVLKAGTGKESVEEMTDTFAKFYQSKGIQLPQKPSYSDRDIEILARAEAEDIIHSGYEDVVEEVDRLNAIGAKNMTAKERAIFKTLAEYRNTAERGQELRKLGVTEDVYDSQDFKDFAGKFAASTPIRDIYDIYNKTQPKKEVRTMGSMKNSQSQDSTVKEFYTRDEALKFTKKDFDSNPALFKAVEESMRKW